MHEHHSQYSVASDTPYDQKGQKCETNIAFEGKSEAEKS